MNEIIFFIYYCFYLELDSNSLPSGAVVAIITFAVTFIIALAIATIIVTYICTCYVKKKHKGKINLNNQSPQQRSGSTQSDC